MIPRGRIDLSWCDWLAAGWGLRCGEAAAERAWVEDEWAAPRRGLVTFSLRSGFLAFLRAVAPPAGSRVLVSAVTIPDMVEIIERCGLVPVPVRVDPQTLAVDPAELARLCDAQTCGVVIAHLFGSRMPMDGLVAFARQHGLWIFEDAAQAFDGSDFRGHPESDAVGFSFGPIKTATALGGGVLVFRDAALWERTRRLMVAWPSASPRAGFPRWLKYGLLKLVATRPGLSLLTTAVSLAGRRDPETLLRQILRGFPGDWWSQLPQQPAPPLIRLLARRLRQNHRSRQEERAHFIADMRARSPHLRRLAVAADPLPSWVFPMLSRDPAGLVRLLRREGFDATSYGSSLIDHGASASCPGWMRQVVYLPLWPALSEAARRRLVRLIDRFEEAA